jgi:hypothetical protein
VAIGIVPTWHAEYPRMPAHGVGFRGRMQPGRLVSDHPYDTDAGAAGPTGHPRPPAGAKQTRSRLLGYVWRSAGGTPPRSTGTRPPLGAGAAVDPGRFTPFLPGPAGIPPCRIHPPLTTSGQENPVRSIHLKDWLGDDQSIGVTKQDAEREANR